MVLGFQNGVVRSYVLSSRKDFGLLGPYGTRWVHDRQYGDISKVAYSYDDRYLLSVGLDGNVFVFKTAETVRLMLGKNQPPVELPAGDTVSNANG